MGVLTDYFRAPNSAAVVQSLEETDGGSPLSAEPPRFEGVDAKGMDPAVVLGQLIAAIRGTAWRVGLVEETTVWPTSPAPGPEGPESEDDPWATGPWVSELSPQVRDTLAGVRNFEVPAVVARWVQAEELEGASAESMRPLADELFRLAARARDAEEQLYCWMSL
ncbi:hypothetical protein ACFT1B_25180 [Streptomyces griseoincarnatus]|uniref:hypothetical protein n=1 Tax=unclassified Streptomyces TaxID=2593676 RepID=UPI000652D172|nr:MULTISPECIES: hypothetical protein [unclassified Streptomyces]MBU5945795.1 hypothetical protein [Streptomyces sp. PAM3C]MUT91634.1 hypothetical protein [Streptomyces sp. Z38]WPW21111.1 hypothetical protein UBV09_21555 [Streptomyces griseoincarnatus]